MSALPILTYHSVDGSGSVLSVAPATFARHMACVEEMGFRGVPLAEALTWREATGRWPERTVALTFDDGYRSLLGAALPVLARHGFRATVYLVTGHVGGENDWETPPPGLGRQPVLDWAQARELADAGWEIGSHTRTHPDLRKLGAAEVEIELRGSREDIERHLGRAAETFAYPRGLSSAIAAAAAQRHYRAGCTTVLRRAGGEPLHSLPRVDMYYLRDPARLRRLLAGGLDRYLTLRRWGRRLSGLLAP